MSEEEILKKMNNDKDYRAKTLINLNVALQRTQRNVARVEDLQEIKEFKIAVVSLENENNELQQENQELKKQLEECYCNRTDCSSRIKDSKQYDSLVQKTEKQQKEFIEYITSYIELLNNKPDLVELGQKDVLEEILAKYKEIIGDKQ